MKYNKSKIAIALIGLILLVIVILFITFSQMSSPERIEDEGFTHADRFSEYIPIDGIDVSYAQGNIDWKKVKKSGVDFVFIRAGFRSIEDGKLHTDETFAANMEGADKAGLMVGAYFYSQAVNAKEAAKEAEYVLKLIEPYRLTLPVVMDYEFYPDGRLEKAYYKKEFSQEHMNKVAKSFCDTVEKEGYESMVYANYDFLVHYLDGESLGERTGIWLAHYNSSTSYPYHYRFWQCTDSSRVPGIETNVDKDFWYLKPDGLIRSSSRNLSSRSSLSGCVATLNDHSSKYIGLNVEPGVTVTKDGKALKEGKDYTLSYVRNTAPGTGYAVVTGIGDYRDTVTVSFKIKKFF